MWNMRANEDLEYIEDTGKLETKILEERFGVAQINDVILEASSTL